VGRRPISAASHEKDSELVCGTSCEHDRRRYVRRLVIEQLARRRRLGRSSRCAYLRVFSSLAASSPNSDGDPKAPGEGPQDQLAGG
jgi:hypothetical protein